MHSNLAQHLEAAGIATREQAEKLHELLAEDEARVRGLQGVGVTPEYEPPPAEH